MFVQLRKARWQKRGRPRPWPSARDRTVASREQRVGQALVEKQKHRSARKRTRRHRRRPQRTSDRRERRTCSDTIEESSSSDEVDARKTRPRSYRESRYFRSAHLQLHGWCSRTTWHSVNFQCYLPTYCSLRLKSRAAFVVRQPLLLNVTLEEPSHGGYAGVRVGEAQNLGPIAHERDRAEERSACRTRINEAGDAVPGSQDSIHHARSSEFAADGYSGDGDAHRRDITHTDPAPPSVPNSRRPTQPRSRQQRDNLRCPRCGSDPEVCTGNTDRGLMMHVGQKHGAQQLSQECVAQLRQLDQAACVSCGTIRSRRCNRCNHCERDTATRDITVCDVFQDRRQPGHQDAAASSPNPHQPPRSRQPVPPGDPLDDRPPPNYPIRDIVVTESDRQLLADLRSASAVVILRCIVSRYGPA